jgi:ectoine hydroxylase-related dioxygenase (phytanoyl-CoA dioxygenase family)
MTCSLKEDLYQKFQDDGYLVLENFLTDTEVNEMKEAMNKIVEEMNPSEHPKSVFTTSDDSRHVSDVYFLDSVDKVRYFYEEGAFNKSGELVVDRQRALNKVGHALHVLNPVFKKVTFSEKVKKLVEILGFKDAVIPQSMYIFKQPGIGGEVTPHIDGTFLLCNPATSVFGLWFPVDDATLENGCLWFVPGSHKNNKVDRRFVRTHGDNNTLLKFSGEMLPPEDSKFVPAPIKKGGCVVIHGLVWHKSEPNKSDKSRHAYTFHVFDQGTASWDRDAWLQPTDSYKFPRMSEN